MTVDDVFNFSDVDLAIFAMDAPCSLSDTDSDSDDRWRSGESIGDTSISSLSSFSSIGLNHEERELPKHHGKDDVASCSAKPDNNAFEEKLSPWKIAFSETYERDIPRLQWGAQWELARLASSGKLSLDTMPKSDIRDGLRSKRSNVEAAAEVARITEHDATDPPANARVSALLAREREGRSPWAELDREQAALAEDQYGGLGSPDSDWYGGKVSFCARLFVNAKSKLCLELDRAVLGPSNRFTRRYGSERFLRVRLDASLSKQSQFDLHSYLRRPFVIFDRVYRGFFGSEGAVFLIRTNETFSFGTVHPPVSGHNFLLELLEWHNPMRFNSEQSMCKWAVRQKLGFSDSVPGIRIPPSNVIFMNDIVCDAYEGRGKVPAEMVMTDGCGLANRAVMRLLQERFNWPEEPTAIQCRIAGAKGMLLRRPDELGRDTITPVVWLRDSQVKIKYSGSPLLDGEYVLPAHIAEDPAMVTIDVLRPANMSAPARLDIETIINLAENGVPIEVLEAHVKDKFEEAAQPFEKWDEGNGSLRLRDFLDKHFGVVRARLARHVGAAARAQGLVSHLVAVEDEEEQEEDDMGSMDHRPEPWQEDPISGQPSSLWETCVELIDSGFDPKNSPILCSKLKYVSTVMFDSMVEKCRFPVDMSCSAIIVPDPCGVLRSGEIHVKCSRRSLVDQHGFKTDQIEGDVLVTRHPCKLPTDVQKVKAVVRYELRTMYDVIVVSTADYEHDGKLLHRHLASMMGGGDYDGDRVNAYWKPEFVERFSNADPSSSLNPPELSRLKEDTTTNTETVAQFLARLPLDISENRLIYELQGYLLAGVEKNYDVGIISEQWQKCIYVRGYNDPLAIYLGHLFSTVLDGSKTGVSIRPAAMSGYKTQFAHQHLKWRVILGAKKPDRNVYAQRLPRLPFVMDILSDHIVKEKAEVVKRIAQKLVPAADLDPVLARPWKDALERVGTCEAETSQLQQRTPEIPPTQQALREGRSLAEQLSGLFINNDLVTEASLMSQDLIKIEGHVRDVSKTARARMVPRRGHSFTDLPITVRQEILWGVSMKFASGPIGIRTFSEDEVERLKASCAYVLTHNPSRFSPFPWNVAFRALCDINARSRVGSAPGKTLSLDIYPWMSVDRAVLK